MKQILIIFGLLISVTTFAQSPRIKLNQITKDNASGSVLISSPTDSGMVYTRDFYISYGVDTVLIFNGDTIRSVVAASVLSDGVTITGDGTSGNELKVDTATISTIKGLVDSLLTKLDVDFGNVTGTLPIANGGTGSTTQNFVDLTTAQTVSGAKTFTSDLNVDAKIALNAGDDNIVIGDGAGASLVSGQALQNVLLGSQAGAGIDSGDYNIAVGMEALRFNTTGYQNTANGYRALYSNISGYNNVAIGHLSLLDNTSGLSNIANGTESLTNNTSGSNNIGLGYRALYLNTTGYDNVGIGAYSLLSLNTTSYGNIAIGSFSQFNLNSGNSNVAIGQSSGRFRGSGSDVLTNATGSLFIGSETRASANGNTNEIVIGTSAIGNGSNSVTIGDNNNDLVVMKGRMELNDGGNSVFIGDGAGFNDDGNTRRNIGIGYEALYSNTTGFNNTAIGFQSLYSNISGNSNVAIGYGALVSNTGSYNTANGFQALLANTIGNNNTANGYQALRNNTEGDDNTANGYQALRNNTTGYNNVANGYSALVNNTTGFNNMANGYKALFNNTEGFDNMASGYETLVNNITGDRNIANGYQAGTYWNNGVVTGNLTHVNNSIFFGAGTQASADSVTNEIVIGTSAIGNGSNTITIGSSSAVSLHTNNYEFDIDQTVSATEDNYVLTYDNADGQISLESIALSNSATLDFGSTSAQSSADLTITVTGAADGDVVSLGVPNASVNANTNYTAWVSAANTVTVRFNNYSSGAVDPASGTFKVKVFK